MSAFEKAVSQVRTDLKEHGKTNVPIVPDSNLTPDIVQGLIKSVAKEQGVEVETKVNKKSVSGKVVTED